MSVMSNLDAVIALKKSEAIKKPSDKWQNQYKVIVNHRITEDLTRIWDIGEIRSGAYIWPTKEIAE